MTALDRIVDALRQQGGAPKASGGAWTARCPAHDDRNPSLGVRQIEASALVHCYAGCQIDDVMTALGLTLDDLYDERDTKYTYTDAAGTPTRYVHRRPGKNFSQSGHTSRTTELYRLPKVIEAVAAGTTVYLVEGEKDVHALESLGAVATTSPMGAGNWSKVDAAPLTGANVVVVPDQDDKGARYCRDIVASLEGVAASVKVAKPLSGKDAADHVAAGHGLDELVVETLPAAHRSLKLTPASSITVRPVRWAWKGRIALGTLALLGGREGIGKSMLAYTLAADVTQGRLPGMYEGTPKAVIVAATEDSWEHTIVPRLMAAGADLERVFRVDVVTAEGVDTGLSLPRDLSALEHAVVEVGAVLILLDPLMSRLDAKLDTHKDAEVRLALEPLVRLADLTGAAVLGLIHVNKSQSTDPLTTLMASRAFAAVARAVIFVMLDPEDESTRLMGQPKNNLGATDLATLTFRIESAHVADTDEGPVFTGRVHWLGETSRSIRDVLETSAELGGTAETRTATQEAADWLEDYLVTQGGTDDSASIRTAGQKAGHSVTALKRARTRLNATSESKGFPRRSFWTLPGTGPQADQDSGSSPGESEPTGLTEPNGQTGPSVGSVGSVGPVSPGPHARAPETWPAGSIGESLAAVGGAA